jgi:uncharacterized membrane protein YfcA
MIDTVLILELAALGLVTGYLAGLLGIGGGMVIGPFMTIIMSGQGVSADLAVKMAIATSMATIIFTSISSVRAHHARGAVRWSIVKGLAPGIVIGGAIGSMGIFALLKGTTLALIFAAFISFSATQMFLDKKPKPGRELPGTLGLAGAGSVIGVNFRTGGSGWRFYQRTVHGGLQCSHHQCSCHQRRARISYCVSECGGLCHQWVRPCGLAGWIVGLYLDPGADRHCVV